MNKSMHRSTIQQWKHCVTHVHLDEVDIVQRDRQQSCFNASCSVTQTHTNIAVRDSTGVRKIRATMTRWTLSQTDPHSPSSPLSKPGSLTIFGVKRRRRRRTLASINTLYYIHLVTHLEGGDHKVSPGKKRTLTYNGTGRTYQRDNIIGFHCLIYNI
jgi:hypothetical protein